MEPSTAQQIRLILADDHLLFRQGVRALLSEAPDLLIVGEVGDGAQAAALIASVNPDVVVLDIALPGMSGIDVTRHVTKLHPTCRVLILSMHAEEAYVQEALQAGALGYLPKASDSMELVQAVRAVHTGRCYLGQAISQLAVARYVNQVRGKSLDPFDSLTLREREILKLTGEGMNGAEIASRLSISRRTVESHRANIMRKLDVTSSAALIRYALRKGLVPLGE